MEEGKMISGKGGAFFGLKLRSAVAILLAVLVLLAGGLLGYKLGVWLTERSAVVGVEDVREELVPVAKLAVYDYAFTDVMHVSDAHRVLGFDIPFTDKHYVATVEGTVSVGIEDAESIECDLSKTLEGRVKSVAIGLPHCTAWNVAIDHESLNVLIDLNGVANSVGKDELNNLYIMVEQEQRAKAETDGTLEKADERVQALLIAHIHSLYGEDVGVSFGYID